LVVGGKKSVGFEAKSLSKSLNPLPLTDVTGKGADDTGAKGSTAGVLKVEAEFPHCEVDVFVGGGKDAVVAKSDVAKKGSTFALL
jgi:hypothetical protein